MKKTTLFSVLFLFSTFSTAQINQFPANGNVQIVNGYDLIFKPTGSLSYSRIFFEPDSYTTTSDGNKDLAISRNGIIHKYDSFDGIISQILNIDHNFIKLLSYRNGDPTIGAYNYFSAFGNIIEAPSKRQNFYAGNGLGIDFRTNQSDGNMKYAGIGIALNNDYTFKHLYMAHGSASFSSILGINILPNGFTGIGTLTPTTTLEIKSLNITESVKAPGNGDSGLRLTHLTSSNTATTGAAPIGVDATGKVVRVAGGGSSSDAWLLNGNLGTTPAISDLAGNITSGNFLGTTDLKPLVIATNNKERLRISTTGRLIFHNNEALTPNSLNNMYLGGGNENIASISATSNSVNTILGIGSFKDNTTGYKNTVVGGNSLYNNTTGNQNTVIGSNSMVLNTTGSNNVALGSGILNKLTTGQYNIYLGQYNATTGITSGNRNIGIGYNAGKNLTTGSNNIIIGSEDNSSFPSTIINAPIGNDKNNQLNIGNWIYGYNGQIAIGSFTLINNSISHVFANNAGYQLIVKEGIKTEKVRVELSSANSWADYVFEKDYDLMSIEDLKIFIDKNKHLPNIPTAYEVQRDGIDLGEMDAKLLEKIEELTLYSIDLYKENVDLKEENKDQQTLLEELLKRVEQLESNK